ncbi:hypothetical protein DAI22_08g194188 [Oryza sativa Japonica Group]|nr:hypothetical protein DAI22_08g194188 [Oryza sativa Japonica Group]
MNPRIDVRNKQKISQWKKKGCSPCPIIPTMLPRKNSEKSQGIKNARRNKFVTQLP